MLVDHILEVFEEYGVPKEQVKERVYFVSDRGPNIKYGLLRNGFKRITCYAHMIHNLVSAMLDQPQVKEIIKNCSKLAAYVKNGGLNAKLKTSLKIYVSTRWNSVHMMISAILSNYNDIYDLLVEKQRAMNECNQFRSNRQVENILEYLTILDIDELKRIEIFLNPFKVK